MKRKEETLETDDWRHEYEKVVLSKKYHAAARDVALAIQRPEKTNIETAMASLYEYVASLPAAKQSTKTQRQEILAKIDTAYTALYGDLRDGATLKAIQELGLKIGYVRQGINKVPRITNLARVSLYLRDVLAEAGDLATRMGLRVTIYEPPVRGARKILEMEGIDPEELEDV